MTNGAASGANGHGSGHGSDDAFAPAAKGVAVTTPDLTGAGPTASPSNGTAVTTGPDAVGAPPQTGGSASNEQNVNETAADVTAASPATAAAVDIAAANLPTAASAGRDSNSSAAANAPPAGSIFAKKGSSSTADSDNGDSAVTGPNLPAQAPPANSMQPVATAIVVPDGAGAAGTAGNAATTSLAIGDQVKARGKLNLPPGSDQTAVTLGRVRDAASDQSPSSPANGDGTPPASASSSAASGNGPAGLQPDGTGSASSPQPPQASAPAANAAATWASIDSIQNAATPSAARTDGQGSTAIDAAASSTNSLGTNAAPKPETAGLTSLGIAVANTASTGAGATPAVSPNTTAAAPVPVAGLPIAIASRALSGSNQFDIRLDPPELGRIDVRLDVNSDGQVTSHVTVDRPDTLSLLQSQQPQLERALEQAGLKTADNGLQFTLRDHSFAGQNNGGNGNPAQTSPAQLVIPDSDLPAVDATQVYSRVRLGGGIDIRV